MAIGKDDLHEEAVKSLRRVQEFDVGSLPRKGDLGAGLNFSDIVEPAQELVDLFRRLSIQALDDFPDPILQVVLSQANSVFQLFSQVLTFDVGMDNPRARRDSMIQQVVTAYGAVFTALHPYISYSLHRSADFQRLDSDARATLQAVEDRSSAFAERMEQHEGDAARVLGEIRKVAAEEGVTQQAAHFRAESELHDTHAESWRVRTVRIAWMLGGFAVFSLFLHKVPILKPESSYDAAQLAISKVLIFAVITYMLVLAARNFLSHRHNAIVNKHRQNALMTHRALVEAATESGARDAIMVHAASCIFSPQSTGYASGQDGDSSSARSVIEILSRPIATNAQS